MLVKMENKRLIGLDFIRVFAMIVVTSIHFVEYSDLIHEYNAIPAYNKVLISFLRSLFPLFVNLFVMLSGFLLCRKQFNLHRILKLWLIVYNSSLKNSQA